MLSTTRQAGDKKVTSIHASGVGKENTTQRNELVGQAACDWEIGRQRTVFERGFRMQHTEGHVTSCILFI